MDYAPTATPATETVVLPGFDGTPYVATKIDANFYHLILLPSDWSQHDQLAFAFRQGGSNRLPTFLVEEPGRALALYPSGCVAPVIVSAQHGIFVIQDKLAPAAEIPPSEELEARRRAFESYAIDQHGGGSVTGDLLKGGRPPTDREAAELAGFGPAGVPKGLDVCPECLEWRGACLDPTTLVPGYLVPVHCSCENIHRCARCGGALYERRLCSNYWDPEGKKIWYVPGFCGFGHECGS